MRGPALSVSVESPVVLDVLTTVGTLLAVTVAVVAVVVQQRATRRALRESRLQATHDRLAALYDRIGGVAQEGIRVLHATVFDEPFDSHRALDTLTDLDHAAMLLMVHGAGAGIAEALLAHAELHREVHNAVAARPGASATADEVKALRASLAPFYASCREHLDRVWPDRHVGGDPILGRIGGERPADAAAP